MTMTATAAHPQIVPMGLAGLLVRFSGRLDDGANRAALAFRAALEEARPEGVEETVSSLGSVFLRFDPGATGHALLSERVAALLRARDWSATPLPAGRRLWTVPAVFDGPDLAAAASLAGLSPAAAAKSLRRRGSAFSPSVSHRACLTWGPCRATGTSRARPR